MPGLMSRGLMVRSSTVVPSLTVLDGGDITIGAGGQLFLPAGDATDPAIAFSDNPDSGIYYVTGSLQVRIGTDGAGRCAFSSNGVVPLSQLAPNSYLALGVTTGITASTTQSQGQGALTVGRNAHVVTTVANANDVVTMPTAVAGQVIFIANKGANVLQIFPASGDNFNGSATDASITLAAGAEGIYVPHDTTEWLRILN